MTVPPEGDVIRKQAWATSIITFPSNPAIVVLSLEPFVINGDELRLRVTDTDGFTYNAQALNNGNEVIPFSLIYGSGIAKIEVRDNSNDGFISQIEERNAENETTLLIQFTDDSTPFLQFNGAFGTLARTNILEETGIRITASVEGDADYAGIGTTITTPPREFDTIFNPGSVGAATGGGGGVPSSTLPDTGVGIVSLSCIDGDTDKDAICNEWEADYGGTAQGGNDGVPFSVGTSDFFYTLAGTTVANDDLLIEIDAMVDPVSGFSHAPPASVLSDVAYPIFDFLIK